MPGKIFLAFALSVCFMVVHSGCAQKGIDTSHRGEKMAAKVNREGSKVYIEGVPKISFGKGHCTFAGTLVACMESMGEDIPYRKRGRRLPNYEH